MRVVFMGTPEFAVPALSALAERLEVVQVVTQPDRVAGRGRRLIGPPVKRRAEELGLPVFQPERIRAPAALDALARHSPEAVAVVGYGQMIPKSIREMPPLGCVNVHSSLLPKYRGAAPVNWAIALGETRTGVTTMRIARQMDAGDILLARETAIGPDETASELNRRLSLIGAELLIETLQGLVRGDVVAAPQDHAAATRAPMLTREDGRIDWSLPAETIHNRLRGFDPWPGVFTFFRGKRLRILAASPSMESRGPSGSVRVEHQRVTVACGVGCLIIHHVQMEGRNRVSSLEFARGARVLTGEVLGDE